MAGWTCSAWRAISGSACVWRSSSSLPGCAVLLQLYTSCFLLVRCRPDPSPPLVLLAQTQESIAQALQAQLSHMEGGGMHMMQVRIGASLVHT